MARDIGTPEPWNPAGRSATIVCFGNSITHGFGVDGTQSFPALLGRLLNTRVINAGLDGDTTEGGLARVDSDVLRHKPDIVTVEFGANDYLMGVDESAVRANIELVIEQTQRTGAKAAVLSLGEGFWGEEFEAALRKAAQNRDCGFLTGLLDGIASNSMMTLDGVHPNAPGYVVIARKIAGFLQETGLLDETRPEVGESEESRN
jgi:acyl-CoA thioesterase-1